MSDGACKRVREQADAIYRTESRGVFAAPTANGRGGA